MKLKFYAFLFIIITMVSCSKDDSSISPLKSSTRLDSGILSSLEVHNGMLVFKDVEHFNKALIELEEWANTGENTSEDSVLLHFANSFEFNSLHKEILTQEDALSASEGINEENDPDNHFIMDPYFRALLNSDLELQIGSKFYKLLDKYRAVEIGDKDLESLIDFRLNKDAAQSFYKPNVSIINGTGGTKMSAGQNQMSCTADFTYTQPNINSTTVNFRNLSSGHTNSTWKIIHNGIVTHTYTTENPSHTFSSFVGNFTVQLELSGNGCTDIRTKTVTLNSCQADFASQVVNQNVVNFTSTSTGITPTSIAWDFGDGTYGVGIYGGPVPTHTYTAPGTYNVKMTITGSSGCFSEITKPVVLNFDGCCEGWDREKEKYDEYISGSRRIKAAGWAKNFGIIGYHRIGAKTKNYRKKNNGNWDKEKADNIESGIAGKIWLNNYFTNATCSEERTIGYTSDPESNKKESDHNFPIGEQFRIRFNTLTSTHYVRDEGVTKTVTIQLGCN